MKTVYLFGAGFSKDVANGPLMRECFARMAEWARGNPQPRYAERFLALEGAIRELEDFALVNLRQETKQQVQGYSWRNDLERLITLLDALFELGDWEFRPELSIMPFDVEFVPGFYKQRIAQVKANLTVSLYQVLAPLCPLRPRKEALSNLFCHHFDVDSDTVATFNYDLVLERALWQLGLWTPNGGWAGVEPIKRLSFDQQVSEKVDRSKVRILKLHGSVNWSPRATPCAHLQDLVTREWLFDGFGTRYGIQPIDTDRGWAPQDVEWALPSLIKGLGDSPLLAAQWRDCQRALAAADRVIAVGFSFPKQDTQARLLLGLVKPGANLVIVAPRENRGDGLGRAEHATDIATAVKPVVDCRLTPINMTFSEWAERGCPPQEA